jgi:hypothetical protein
MELLAFLGLPGGFFKAKGVILAPPSCRIGYTKPEEIRTESQSEVCCCVMTGILAN